MSIFEQIVYFVKRGGDFVPKIWHWQPTYGLEAIVDDFLADLRDHPERCR